MSLDPPVLFTWDFQTKSLIRDERSILMSTEEAAVDSSCGNSDRIKWGTIIPLIGGSSLGCEKSTGSLPQFHLGFSKFASNDKHIRRYRPKVPYYNLDVNPNVELGQVDYVNSVCPCAGLSTMNVSKDRGSNADSNHWMLDTSTYILSKLRPAVMWGENAPGLFTTAGEGLVQKLCEIGVKLGYSFSLMRTSTVLHGIPQRRVRTFYFFWNSPTVPMMNYKRVVSKDWLSYLKEIPEDASQQVSYTFSWEVYISVSFRICLLL